MLIRGKGTGVRESAHGCEIEVCSHTVTSKAHDIVIFGRKALTHITSDRTADWNGS
jgi:hypothetical protein